MAAFTKPPLQCFLQNTILAFVKPPSQNFQKHHCNTSRTTITVFPEAPYRHLRNHHPYQDFKIITAGTTADTPKKEGFFTDLLRGRAHILTIIMVYYPPPPAVSILAAFQPSPQNRF